MWAATTLLVPRETGMVSSPHSSPSPFLPHPLAVSPPICEGGVQARKRQGTIAGAAGVELRRQESIHTHSHTRAHTHAQSAQVKQVLAAFSAEFPDSLLFISRHAAEKEEFHFWSLWRVRMNIFIDCRTPKPLHNSQFSPVWLWVFETVRASVSVSLFLSPCLMTLQILSLCLCLRCRNVITWIALVLNFWLFLSLIGLDNAAVAAWRWIIKGYILCSPGELSDVETLTRSCDRKNYEEALMATRVACIYSVQCVCLVELLSKTDQGRISADSCQSAPNSPVFCVAHYRFYRSLCNRPTVSREILNSQTLMDRCRGATACLTVIRDIRESFVVYTHICWQ